MFLSDRVPVRETLVFLFGVDNEQTESGDWTMVIVCDVGIHDTGDSSIGRGKNEPGIFENNTNERFQP